MQEKKTMQLRVAVVGAGAAGLIALRHLTANPQKFIPVAFEMTPYVSGTWVYTDRIGQDERGLPLHSSMYKNLRTNLPKEVMALPDFPFQKDLPSFISHKEVKKYLEDYADHFKLQDYIQFNTKVEHIAPRITDEGRQVWDVDTCDVTHPTPSTDRHQFDAVMVCNGHYAVPLTPELTGLDRFQGTVVHSHSYRIPDMYRNQRVAILGAASSGQDMALDIAPSAKHVYLCHRTPPIKSLLPRNISQEPVIKEVLPRSVILADNQEVEIDSILLCTGYRFKFPFLSAECRPDITDERVTPLYKHILHTRFPALCFIGICKVIDPFPQFYCQVKFFLAALLGDLKLPSPEEMEQLIEADFQSRLAEGMPVRYAHHMGPRQWAYNDDLADLAGFERIPPVVRTLYEYVQTTRRTDLPGYKAFAYELINDEQFKLASK